MRDEMKTIRGDHGKYTILSQPVDELILFEGFYIKAMECMRRNGVPVWMFSSIRTIYDIDVPKLYKLTIFTRWHFSNVIDEILLKFRDRCYCLEVACWNSDIDDYVWYVDDPDFNYLELKNQDIEEENNEYIDIGDEGYLSDCQPMNILKQKSFDDYLDESDVDGQYLVKKNGVWVRVNDNKEDDIRLSYNGMLVIGMARTERQNSWMKLLVWTDADGKLHERLFPSEDIQSFKGVKEFLCSQGCQLTVDADKYLRSFLLSFQPEIRYRLVRKTGWYTDSEGRYQFALPNQIVGSRTGEQLYFHPDSATNCNGIGQKGRLQLWQKFIAGVTSGNPLLIFTLSAAFASPLLRIIGGETGGFHFYGQTSVGKTTAMMVAASVWGNAAPPSNTSGKSFINTWKATANALEGVAAARNDVLLILDELGQAELDNVAKTVYDLCSGAGKERMTRDSNLADKLQWREIFVSTGEISSKEAMEQLNSQVKGGQLIRLIDIDIEDGIIQDSHDLSPEAFVGSLRSRCANHYGWAGPLFVEKLIEVTDPREGEKELEQEFAACCDLLCSQKLEEAKHRVLKRFALVLLAGMQAVRFGILPLEEEEVVSAVQSIWSKWLKTGESLNDRVRAIEKIRDFLTANISKFYDMSSDRAVPTNYLGFKKKISGEIFYLFPTATLTNAVNTSNHRNILRELYKLELLHRNNGTRFQSRFSDPSVSDSSNAPKLSLYAISAKILEYGQPDENSGNKRRVVRPPKRHED